MTEPRLIPGSQAPDDTFQDRSLYFNREISWLAFNHRVLEEALEPSWPLLERIKFLSIFHSNLDEFFMIRVSGLHEQLEAEVTERSPDGLSPHEQLRAIVKRSGTISRGPRPS
jgi:polyphosphate kinase